MKSVKTFALSAALGVLAASAAASPVTGQVFHFNTPAGVPDSSNAMFVTNSFAGFDQVTNVVGDGTSSNDTVSLLVDNYSSSGVDHLTPVTAQYFLQSYVSAPTTEQTNFADYDNSSFTGTDNAGSAATGAGLLTFTDASTHDILLQVSFDASLLQATGFSIPKATASNGQTFHFLGGSLYQNTVTDPAGTANAGFAFTNSPTDASYHLSGLSFSFGNTNPVPEPSSVAALALGGLALLRRRRRA